MKKIILSVFLLVCSYFTYGQDEYNEQEDGRIIGREWAADIGQYFRHLETNRIPHGILLDYAMEFTDISIYNGKDENIYENNNKAEVDIGVFSDIYKTLQMGRIHPSTQEHFVEMEKIANIWGNFRKIHNQEENTTLVLSGLYYKYSKISQRALDTGLLHSEMYYQDVYVDNVWQNPYEEESTIAITPPIQIIDTNQFEVLFPRELLYGNALEEIERIEIDFSDGNGPQNLPFNEPITVNYEEDGTYTWVFRTFLNDGRILTSITKMLKKLSQKAPENHYISNGKHSAWIRTKTSANHQGRILKPFIIAEGFDPNSVLTPEKHGGSLTLSDFTESLNSTSELREILTDSDSAEYDLIYIDWINGVGDIRENAKTLQKVITWVNNQKSRNGSTEQNVLLGQSMGGLISRYSLAKMEQQNKKHDVRLFVMHDSPLQGSNTPLSIQYLSRHALSVYTSNPLAVTVGEVLIPFIQTIGSLFDSDFLADYTSPNAALTLQDTPAAMQMNKYYVTLRKQATEQPHIQWQNEFDQVGYPTQSRNIAISNGNQCGIGQGFSGRDKLVSIHGSESSGNDRLRKAIFNLAVSAWGFTSNNPILGFIGHVPGSSKVNYDFDVLANPETWDSNREIYYGKIRYHKKIIRAFGLNFTVSTNITSQSNSISSSYLPMETYAGGYNNIENAVGSFSDFIDGSFPNPKHNFIPIVSALDIRKQNGALNDQDYRASYPTIATLTNGYYTPLKNYISETEKNARHISFNSKNGSWLREELNGNSADLPDCSFLCTGLNAPKIGGTNLICNSEIFTSPTISEIYNWQIVEGSNIVTMSGQGSSQITLTRKNNLNGQIKIQLTLRTAICGETTIYKDVWVGKPVFTFESTLRTETMAKTKLVFTGNVSQNVNSISWEKISENSFCPINFYGSGMNATAHGSCYNWSTNFKVSVTNACGTTVINSSLVPLPSSKPNNPGNYPQYRVMPTENENTYEVTKLYVDKYENVSYIPIDKNNRVTMAVYNLSSQLLIRSNTSTINISTLLKGIYLITAIVNEKEFLELKIIKN
ncbi:T9SS type A sorting domain-containing protein [Flavobacterium sp. NKUCC04_CG]|uniref:T9SS type A sorting domain-containing protein n=1 Tax=Flavobacterium sp. NKUCC04_CG TaxID=2842121 RepID=UPI001C5BD8B6|nr:T9SS type A sorting domain-containing protein [Flavobacterium sp. NKUCC04_CG]MBW3518739.1 T9SS type A sorting domain-containing protein [Flavobacterium sp. NKUCC04_CG]